MAIRSQQNGPRRNTHNVPAEQIPLPRANEKNVKTSQNVRTSSNTRNTAKTRAASADARQNAGRGAGRKRPLTGTPPTKVDPAAVHKFKVIVVILGCLLLTAAFAYGGFRLRQALVFSDRFKLEEITVSGNKHLSADAVIERSGLVVGESIFAASLPDVESSLLADPWISSVAIERVLPSRVTLKITEREPKFWVLKDHSIYYIDKDANLIAPLESENFISLPALDIGPGGENLLDDLNAFMDNIRTAKLPFDVSQISKLRLSAANGFELYWEKRKLVLCIALDDWKGNLARLASVITDLEKKKEISIVREIRAVDGRVWVSKE